MTAAIMGAHTLGSAKPHNSGYNGFWSDEKNSGIFNNNFYFSLIGKGWMPELGVGGNPNKNQWLRMDLGTDEHHKEMMLTTDLCLAFANTPSYDHCTVENKGVSGKKAKCAKVAHGKSTPLDPRFHDCCAWGGIRPLE